MGNCNSRCFVDEGDNWYKTATPTVSIPPATCPSVYSSSDYLSSRSFDRIIDGLDDTKTLKLDGSGDANWDNTLVQNCYIHDTPDAGIFLRDVSNVVIFNCTFRNIGGLAAIWGPSGTSNDVLLLQNKVQNCNSNGFLFAQRFPEGKNHNRLQIIDNEIDSTGLIGVDSVAPSHGMYISSADFLIEGNRISGTRDGSGISVRSSGIINCNQVSGTSQANREGIRYGSDHEKGPSNRLEITDNVLYGQGNQIRLGPPANRYDGQCPSDHVVKDFFISGNVFSGGGEEDGRNIMVACNYGEEPIFSYWVSDNVVVD